MDSSSVVTWGVRRKGTREGLTLLTPSCNSHCFVEFLEEQTFLGMVISILRCTHLKSSPSHNTELKRSTNHQATHTNWIFSSSMVLSFKNTTSPGPLQLGTPIELGCPSWFANLNKDLSPFSFLIGSLLTLCLRVCVRACVCVPSIRNSILGLWLTVQVNQDLPDYHELGNLPDKTLASPSSETPRRRP